MSVHQHINVVGAHASDDLVIALHCSGGSARHWRPFAELLGPSVALRAADLHLAFPAWEQRTSPWRLEMEAAPFIEAPAATAP